MPGDEPEQKFASNLARGRKHDARARLRSAVEQVAVVDHVAPR
jgi:hypothetical protein